MLNFLLVFVAIKVHAWVFEFIDIVTSSHVYVRSPIGRSKSRLRIP